MAYTDTKTGSPPGKSGVASKQYPVIRTEEASIEKAGIANYRLHNRMATIKNDDERLLARIGYRQVSYCDSCKCA